MTPGKDGSKKNLDERNKTISSDFERVNDEDHLDTREISHQVEEGEEDYDDEELTEDDFKIDGEEEEA